MLKELLALLTNTENESVPIEYPVYMVFHKKENGYPNLIELFKKRTSAEIFIANQMHPDQYHIRKGWAR